MITAACPGRWPATGPGPGRHPIAQQPELANAPPGAGVCVLMNTHMSVGVPDQYQFHWAYLILQYCIDLHQPVFDLMVQGWQI